MKQKVSLLALINFLLFSIGYTTSKGTTTASFLKISVGARNIAMGETGATSEDINSIYWNPAGLASIDNIEASLMHSVWLETISYEHLTFGLPTKFGNIGFAINYLFMGEMDKYDYAGDKQGSMTASDLALTFGLSRKVLIKEGMPYLKFGANIKYLHSKLEEEKADALATDLGLQTELKNPKVKIGLVIQNIGTGMKFIKESCPLPTNIKLGAGYSLVVKNNPLNLAFDINIPNDNNLRINFGTEYEINCGKNIIVSPRIGYGAYKEGLEGLSGITAGIGFKYQNYFIDYAFVPYGQLGNTHRISLSMEFSKEKIKVLKKKRGEDEEEKLILPRY
jgi:hypothetical protein